MSKETHGSMIFGCKCIFLTQNNLFVGVNVLARVPWTKNSETIIVRFLPQPDFLSAEPVASIFTSSWSSAKLDHCLSGHHFSVLALKRLSCFKTQNFVLISENNPWFSITETVNVTTSHRRRQDWKLWVAKNGRVITIPVLFIMIIKSTDYVF